MIASIIDMMTSMIFLETYKVGKIILTTLLGVKVAILSYKIWNGLNTEKDKMDTIGLTLIVGMYYFLPLIKNIIIKL